MPAFLILFDPRIKRGITLKVALAHAINNEKLLQSVRRQTRIINIFK